MNAGKRKKEENAPAFTQLAPEKKTGLFSDQPPPTPRHRMASYATAK